MSVFISQVGFWFVVKLKSPHKGSNEVKMQACKMAHITLQNASLEHSSVFFLFLCTDYLNEIIPFLLSEVKFENKSYDKTNVC